MSGNDLAYHLRVNKAIERNLFIDLLTRVGRVRNISGYEYIGFGGPFLEDYKALHATLRISRMHSIECDENTHRRQKFNLPASFIQLHDKHSSDFFRTHVFSDEGTVVWLDYTGSGSLKEQIDEFRNVVSKLDRYDVAKLTLQANPDSLGNGDGSAKPHELPALRAEKLAEVLSEYVPADLSGRDVTSKTYPTTLQKCVENSLSAIPAGIGKRYFQILSSFVYKDGQTMLTITGMIFEAKDDTRLQDFLEQSRLSYWPFINSNWSTPVNISVPNLSAKERMRLDEQLPSPAGPTLGQDLETHLGFRPSSSTDELANYARYYRHYPHFSRVVL